MFHLDFLARETPPQSPLPSDGGTDDLIRWDQTMSVGNALIDGEHREIIAILNTVYRDWSHAEHRLNVGRTLESLSAVVETHFANEEEILSRHRCPHLAAHQRAHMALLTELAGIGAMFGTLGGDQIEDRMVRFIRSLVLDHVLSFDMDLKAYMHL